MTATKTEVCRQYYQSNVWRRDMRWLGVRVLKSPCDLFSYQEILYETRPDVLVETGSADGGSALFFASLFDLLGKGRVLSLDVEHKERPAHERIRWLAEDSSSPQALGRVLELLDRKDRVMVVLDSDHHMQHVCREMELFAPLVSPGCYLVVEDTCLNTMIEWKGGPGPAEAVERFLRKHREFRPDRRREKFSMTFNPGGFLQRLA